MAIIVKPHIRLAWGGVLGAPATEVWTNSLAFTGVTDLDSEAFDLDDMKAAIVTCAAKLSTYMAANGRISNAAFLSWVKLNKIGVDGKYLDNPNTYILPTPVAGSVAGGAGGPIWQQSSVVSLLTGQTRGRGSKGRIYPPACGAGVDGGGLMTAATVATMQAAAVTLIGDLNKITFGARSQFPASGPRWNACIVSNSVRGLPGLLTPITRVYVDAIPDVQRRRVNRLKGPTPVPTTTYINT